VGHTGSVTGTLYLFYFYYKKSALVYTSSKRSSHKNFRSSSKCPQFHCREYVKPSTAVIMCQQPSMNLFITNKQAVYARNQQCNTCYTPPNVRTTTPTARDFFFFTQHRHTIQSSARHRDIWLILLTESAYKELSEREDGCGMPSDIL